MRNDGCLNSTMRNYKNVWVQYKLGGFRTKKHNESDPRRMLHCLTIGAMVLQIFLLGILFPGEGRAQQEEAPVDFSEINWAYATAFGTGVYRVRDDLDVFILHMQPSWTKKIAWNKLFGARPVLLEIRFPLTFGVHSYHFEGILEEFLDLDIRQVSFAPGAVIELPMSGRWTLRPYGHLGWGTQTRGEKDSAWIYWGGIKSRLKFSFAGQSFGLLNGLTVYGYKPSFGASQDFSELLTGLEWDIPLGKLHWQEEPLFLKTHFVYYYYLDHLKFIYEFETPPELSWQWEIGLSLGKKSKIKIWFFSFERIGVAYRYGRDTRGIRIYTRSTFN